MSKRKPVYLDNAATTPLSKKAFKAMHPWLEERYGNPSTIYKLGRDAKKAIERARVQVAKAINADPEEIYFTSGGTEADNWAISAAGYPGYVLTSEIEHHAVTNAIKANESRQIICLETNKDGTVYIPSVKEADHIIFIYYPRVCSLMLLNNELGTVQDVAMFRDVFKRPEILIHTDAVQAIGHMDVDVKALGVDMLSMSAHKFNGPKGVGALYISKSALPSVLPFMNGGGQERGMRSSTENVAGIVGMGAALEEAMQNLEEREAHVVQLKKHFLECCDSLKIPFVENVPFTDNGILSIRIPGFDSETLMVVLDNMDVCVAAGSACNTDTIEPSHVLKAIGLTDAEASSTLRISFGHQNTFEEVEYAATALSNAVKFLKDGVKA